MCFTTFRFLATRNGGVYFEGTSCCWLCHRRYDAQDFLPYIFGVAAVTLVSTGIDDDDDNDVDGGISASFILQEATEISAVAASDAGADGCACGGGGPVVPSNGGDSRCDTDTWSSA